MNEISRCCGEDYENKNVNFKELPDYWYEFKCLDCGKIWKEQFYWHPNKYSFPSKTTMQAFKSNMSLLDNYDGPINEIVNIIRELVSINEDIHNLRSAECINEGIDSVIGTLEKMRVK